MSKICIHIPDSELEHTVGLEVTVGEERRLASYRVESFEWPERMSSMERVDKLREFVYGYDPDWQLVQIGPAVRDRVPITFRQTKDVSGRSVEIEEGGAAGDGSPAAG